jgi:hypothetical protein
MSFDIFFQPCRFGDRPIERMNPLTGKPQSSLPNEPLTPAELDAVRHLLERTEAAGPDEHGCYVVRFGDGGGAEVFGGDLRTGCMVAVRGITPDLLQFLIDLLRAGNWVMLPAMEGDIAITASPESLRGVPDGFPRVVICDSAEELGVLLTDGFGAWQRYRDQVAGSEE